MMSEKLAWIGFILSLCVLTGFLFSSWFSTMRPILERVKVEKTYRAWGPVDCPSEWICDDDQCCVTCVNLATGEPVVRCRDRSH